MASNFRPTSLLTLVAYSAGYVKRAFIEPLAVGEALPDMPLFLEPELYVPVSLEATYQAAFEAVPRQGRDVLQPLSSKNEDAPSCWLVLLTASTARRCRCTSLAVTPSCHSSSFEDLDFRERLRAHHLDLERRQASSPNSLSLLTIRKAMTAVEDGSDRQANGVPRIRGVARSRTFRACNLKH